jgi:hypothetical protein
MSKCPHCAKLKSYLQPHTSRRFEVGGLVERKVHWCWPCIYEDLAEKWRLGIVKGVHAGC